jgi:hypothetical protein
MERIRTDYLAGPLILCLPAAEVASCLESRMEDFDMKLSIGLAAAALLATGFVTATPKPASAVIYCTYVGYPAGCIARAGVVLRPRPVARAAVRHNAGGNANGGVNRVGVRR